MIFDSSVWIDYFRGNGSSNVELLDNLLSRYEDVNVHLCPPIFQEVLQGLHRSEDPESVKELLLTCQLLKLDPYFAAESAAGIYRSIRVKGITVRKPNDCIIAFYAIHFKMELAHNDSDFDKIAKHTSLKVYRKK
ncbi:VapC ribonuclease [Cytophagales bacterium WSM2-2]|nr:VapC ribonuclease [Cytophagales bacterium WSM2-2]